MMSSKRLFGRRLQAVSVAFGLVARPSRSLFATTLQFLRISVSCGVAMAPLVSASAAPLYWGSGGVTQTWSSVSNWYSDAGETSVSIAAPTASDDVFFNTTPDNTLGGTVTVSSSAAAKSLTFNTSNATTLSQSGNQTLTLGSGGITLNAGTATLGVSSATLSVQLTDSQTWTNNSTGLLSVRSVRASDSAAGAVALTLNAANSGQISFSLALADSINGGKSLGLVIDSAGTGAVTMPSSTYTGGTEIRRGLLSTTGNVGAGGITLGHSSGTATARLNIASGNVSNAVAVQAGSSGGAIISGAGTLLGNIVMNRNLSVGNASTSGAQTLTLSGDISGSGDLTAGRVAGGSQSTTVVLSGNSTYTGKTIVESATVVVNSLNSVNGGAAASSLGAPTTVAKGTISLGAVASSGLRYVGTGETTDRVLDLAGTTSGVTLEQAGSGLLKFTSNLAATGNGSKTLTLTGSTAGAGEISGVIVNSSTHTALAKAGTGKWTLSGLNTYTGATTISAGVLEVNKLAATGIASSIGAGIGNLVLNGAGTLRYIGTGDSTNRVFTIGGGGGGSIDASGSGAVKFTATSIAYGSSNVAYAINLIGDNTGDNTYAANQGNNGTGAFSLVKDGIGTWVLTGSNTYSGGTTINNGTLLVNNVAGSGAGSGGVSLASQAVLGGTGSVAGLVTAAAADSRISAGSLASPIGNLTLAGGLTAASGATFLIGVDGFSVDTVNFGSGPLSLASTVTLDFTDLGSVLTETTYNLFSGTGDWSGSSGASFVFEAPDGYLLNTAYGSGKGYVFDTTSTSKSLSVQFVAVVPEPSTCALLIGSGLVGFGLACRKARPRGSRV